MKIEEFKSQFEAMKLQVKDLKELGGKDNPVLLEMQTKLESTLSSFKVENETNVSKIEALSTDLEKAQGKILEMSEQMVKNIGIENASMQITNELRSEKFNKWVNSRSKENFAIEMIAGDVSISENVDDYTAIPFLGVPTRNPLVDVVAPSPTLLDLVNNVATDTQHILESYIVDKDGEPIYINEVGEGGQVDFLVKHITFETERIASYTVVSKKMLDVVSYMATQINIVLMRKMKLKMNDMILNGDGISPNISGIKTLGASFSGALTGLNQKMGALTEANKNEILIALLTQMKKSYFNPNFIMLNPTDIALLQLQKDNTGNFILQPFANTTASSFRGIPVIEDNNMAEGSFMGLDTTLIFNYILKNITIEVGYFDRIWLTGQQAIMCTADHVIVINPNNKNCVVSGDFATAAAELTTP